MSTEINIDNLIKLRKLTQIVSEHLGNKIQQHLQTLKPLFNPSIVFGQYINGQTKASVATAGNDFAKLKADFDSLRRSKPYLKLTELGNQLDVFGSSVEINPYKYQHIAKRDGQENRITITSPMKWVISYKNLGIGVLDNLVGGQKIDGGVDLQECVLHYLVLNAVIRNTGLKDLLEDLQFPTKITEQSKYGNLPILSLSCPVSTKLPNDDILIDTTEISGTAAFEEVIDIDSISSMEDPFKNHLLEIVNRYDAQLLANL